ncbi:MAG: CDGSH iron-sulfur domain-containing protein [Pseudomonadota bacterium]|nr:CDGSH iron-sulfur domain-containing protein [Pseudomonadota bacterium]
MSEPIVAGKEPIEVSLEPGEYWWCSCGRSKNQPYCDGSHAGTEFTPTSFKVEAAGPVWLCACKHSANPPFCDGAHELLD